MIRQAESTQSTKPKGGKRPGAGRKPSTIKGIAKKLPRETAELLLAEIKANAKWVELSQSDDERIVFEVLRYLTDRAHGKPMQAIESSGPNGGAIPIHAAVTVKFVSGLNSLG